MVSTAIYEEIKIPGGHFSLPGELEIPQNSSSLVLFSHGSGSSRLSPRNQSVAKTLGKMVLVLFFLICLHRKRIV